MTKIQHQSETSVNSLEGLNKYLSFQVEHELFAINIVRVKEIIEYGEVELTSMPMMPRIIRGALNLRGKVVPVIDLSIRLGQEETELTRRTCIIVVENKINDSVMDVGVVVDAVSQVLEIAADDIEPAPTFDGKINADFIDGMGKVNGRFVILLNMDAALSMDDIELLSKADVLDTDVLQDDDENPESNLDQDDVQMDMLESVEPNMHSDR